MSDIVVLNHGYSSSDGFARRTAATGRQYSTFTVQAEPLIHDFDAKALGQKPAMAIAQFFRDRIGSISSKVSPATLRSRVTARAAFDHVAKQRQTAAVAKASKASNGPRPSRLAASPKPPARATNATGQSDRRYAGGRLGPMPPNADGTGRLFNDSGRLLASIVASASQDAWTINVAANRLDPATLNPGGAGSSANALSTIVAQLTSLIPEFNNAALLMDSIPVRRALNESIAGMIKKADMRTSELLEARAKALIGIGKGLLSLVA